MKGKLELLEPKEVLAYTPWFYKIPNVGVSNEHTIANVLLGNYKAVIGKIDNEAIGIVCYCDEKNKTTRWIMGVYWPNHTKEFRSMFYTYCKEQGINEIKCNTIHNPRAFSKLFDMNIVYSQLRREL